MPFTVLDVMKKVAVVLTIVLQPFVSVTVMVAVACIDVFSVRVMAFPALKVKLEITGVASPTVTEVEAVSAETKFTAKTNNITKTPNIVKMFEYLQIY